MDNYDFLTQQEELLRRQKLVEALSQGQPLQNAGGTTGTMGSSIANMIGKIRASGMREQLNQDQTAFRGRYSEALGNETNQFLDRMNGKPEQMPADNYGPPTPAVAANPREAVIRAMTSQLPEMQAMGKAGMASAMKPQEIKQHIVDGQLIEGIPGGQQRVAFGSPKAVDNFGPMETRPGPDGRSMMGQVNLRTNEFVPKGNAGQTINIGDKGQGKLQDVAIKAMEDTRTTVMGVQKQMDAAQRILTLAEDPQVQTGFGANALTGLSSLGAKLGFNGPEGAAKTQALMTDLAQKALDAGQQMKGSFSDNDIKFLMDVTAGKVDYNAETIKHMALLAYTAGHNTLQSALGQYHGAKEKAPEGADKIFPIPNVSYDARISDRPGFSIRDGGYLRYDGLPGQTPKRRASDAAQSGQRKVISMEEFLGTK